MIYRRVGRLIVGKKRGEKKLTGKGTDKSSKKKNALPNTQEGQQEEKLISNERGSKVDDKIAGPLEKMEALQGKAGCGSVSGGGKTR